MYRLIQNINNGTVSGQKSMPLKDITSNNESQFQLARHTYSKSLITTPLLENQKLMKKWYGNKDASSVIARKKSNSVGVGSFNADGGIYSMTTYNDTYSQHAALSRARAGGAVAPPKKAARPTIR
tara:strand:+ start:383 stop:757 length:375 start_codon:yes stop_codon:yes gene_type:complete